MKTTRTEWTLSKGDMDNLTWHTTPRDAGQIVAISYALCAEAELVLRRRHDQSDGAVTIDAAEAAGIFEPWNGYVGTVDGNWLTVVVK